MTEKDITIRFTGSDAIELKKLADRQNMTIGQLLNRAVSWNAIISKEFTKGNRVLIADKDGNPLKEFNRGFR